MSPSGSAHSATAQLPLQLRPPACVSLRPVRSLAQAVETAWSVEPVCATTPISMKDPTVSTTRPSANDTEASSAMVLQFVIVGLMIKDR